VQAIERITDIFAIKVERPAQLRMDNFIKKADFPGNHPLAGFMTAGITAGLKKLWMQSAMTPYGKNKKKNVRKAN
jgi:hypothetical protein